MFLVNGSYSETLSLHDRALHYGDGLFETLAVLSGAPLLWDRHMARLQHGCEVLGIPPPSPTLLYDEAASLCRGRDKHVLKIIVSRGPGGRGYLAPAAPAATRILGIYDWPQHPASYWGDGIAVQVCRLRLAIQPALAGIKHLNRMEQVLARMEIDDAIAAEGLLLDSEGFVIEGTMSNVFAAKGRNLSTPDLSRAGVEGTIRSLIRERASEWNLGVKVCRMTLDDMNGADEVFFTNSTIGIWPARRIGGNAFQAGPISHEISRILAGENCIIQRCGA